MTERGRKQNWTSVICLLRGNLVFLYFWHWHSLPILLGVYILNGGTWLQLRNLCLLTGHAYSAYSRKQDTARPCTTGSIKQTNVRCVEGAIEMGKLGHLYLCCLFLSGGTVLSRIPVYAALFASWWQRSTLFVLERDWQACSSASFCWQPPFSRWSPLKLLERMRMHWCMSSSYRSNDEWPRKENALETQRKTCEQ